MFVPVKTRLIPGTTHFGVTRGGGSETVEWARNGPFRLTRTISTVTPGIGVNSWNKGEIVFAGVPSLPSGSPDSESTIRANGSTAVSRSHPLSPSVSLLTSAGELAKDGVPSPMEFIRWKREVRDILRTASGNFLSYHFAWLPLLADIRRWARQVERSDAIIAEAKSARSKSVIKVGYRFPSDLTSEKSTTTAITRWWASNTSTGDGASATTVSKAESKTWFEAEYVNLMPIEPDQYSKSQEFRLRAKHLLGLELTPETLWELAPWSWAVDWATNFGDVLSSVSNTLSDGLVMRDGFVMHHWRREAVMTCQPVRYALNPNITLWSGPGATIVNETKLRFPSVPYFGFGSVGDLTDRQLSILAALAIQRA